MKPNGPDDFWALVRKTDDCWLFEGSKFNNGYGRFFIGRKAITAHKFSYELSNGPVPTGLMLLHKCNVRLCVNPNHLVPGTNSENQRHAILSGSYRVGASGIAGVRFDEKRGYWTAGGYEMSRRKNLYTGPSKEKAVAARKAWEQSYGINFSKEITMKTFKNRAAQGDLFLRRIDRLPENLRPAQAKDGHFVVAESETHHHHIIDALPNVRVYDTEDPLLSYLEVIDATDAMETLLRHLRGHDTHETISIPPGIYELRRQREYSPEGWRRAAD